MTDSQIQELYVSSFTGLTFEQCFHKLETELSGKPYTVDLRALLCGDLLFSFSIGYTHYKKRDITKSQMVKLFVDQAAKLPENQYYFWAVYYYFANNTKDVWTC